MCIWTAAINDSTDMYNNNPQQNYKQMYKAIIFSDWTITVE